MKTIIAIALAAFILAPAPQAQAQTNDQNGSLCGAALILSAIAFAGVLIVYANNNSTRNCCVGPADLVLQQDNYNGVWLNIATNHIPATCHTNKWEVFRERMDGTGCRYRVKIIPTTS